MASNNEKTEPAVADPESEDCTQHPCGEEPGDETALLQEKYDDLQDKHLRLMAEYDNFRKRSAREKDEIYSNATAAVLGKFLPVQDDFERARQYACNSEEFAKGFEMIEKNFSGVLCSLGVEAFGEVGDAFDPQKHHAVMHIEDEALGENVVAQVLQKGYKIGDKILRCAMVQTAN